MTEKLSALDEKQTFALIESSVKQLGIKTDVNDVLNWLKQYLQVYNQFGLDHLYMFEFMKNISSLGFNTFEKLDPQVDEEFIWMDNSSLTNTSGSDYSSGTNFGLAIIESRLEKAEGNLRQQNLIRLSRKGGFPLDIHYLKPKTKLYRYTPFFKRCAPIPQRQ